MKKGTLQLFFISTLIAVYAAPTQATESEKISTVAKEIPSDAEIEAQCNKLQSQEYNNPRPAGYFEINKHCKDYRAARKDCHWREDIDDYDSASLEESEYKKEKAKCMEQAQREFGEKMSKIPQAPITVPNEGTGTHIEKAEEPAIVLNKSIDVPTAGMVKEVAPFSVQDKASDKWGWFKCKHDCSEKACRANLKFAYQCISKCKDSSVDKCRKAAAQTIQDSKFDEAIENKKRQCNETYDGIRARIGRPSNGIDPGGSFYYNHRLSRNEKYRQNCLFHAVNPPPAAPTSTPTPTNSFDDRGP